jgi:alpha-L-fucosidase 2
MVERVSQFQYSFPLSFLEISMSLHFMKKCIRLLAIPAMMVLGAQTVSAAPNLTPYAGQMSGEASAPSDPLTLWYRYSAREWTSALPIGNGIQGAMMYGGIDNEVICLNEDTLWAGGPYSPENPDGVAALPQIRQLLLDGKYKDADSLISKTMMGKPATQMPYQPVGELHLATPVSGTVENYIRTLDLSTATATVKYTVDGVTLVQKLC